MEPEEPAEPEVPVDAEPEQLGEGTVDTTKVRYASSRIQLTRGSGSSDDWINCLSLRCTNEHIASVTRELT